jgi:hypothetical protein
MKDPLRLVQATTLAGMLLVNQVSTVMAQSPTPTDTPTAQTNDLQITAIPPRLGEDFSLRAKPGQTIQTTVRVKNSSNVPQTYKSLVEDFVIGDDGKEPVPVGEDTPSQWSLAKWITITPPVNTLQPNQSATINVLIEVPADALPGGRYAMIMHEPAINQGLGGGAAAGISQRVGTLLYFMVEGDVNEEAYIRDVKVNNFFENGPIPFSFTLENRSDIHIRPQIQVEMTNMFGQNAGSVELDTLNIFPYTQRDFSDQWEKKWGFGRYEANIVASYGTQGKIVKAVFSFWIIPVKLILGILISIISILGAIIFLKKQTGKKSAEKNKEIQMLEEKVKKLESEKLHQFKDENN